jgi:hypothetical protein
MTSRTPLVLSTSNDWEPWLELIKIAAIEYDIWKYINPNQPIGAIPILVKPVEPSPANVKANIRVPSASGPNTYREPTYLDLNSEEREYLRWLTNKYDNDHRIYRQQFEALGKLRVKIQETVNPKHFNYTRAESAYEVMVKLKGRFKPTDYNQQITQKQRSNAPNGLGYSNQGL